MRNQSMTGSTSHDVDTGSGRSKHSASTVVHPAYMPDVVVSSLSMNSDVDVYQGLYPPFSLSTPANLGTGVDEANTSDERRGRCWDACNATIS